MRFTNSTNLVFILLLLHRILWTPILLGQSSKYWIQFTDKNNSPYSINVPLDYLSQKAVDRRNKYGISIKKNDLPVNPDYIDSIRSMGVQVLTRSKWFNAITIYADSITLDSIKTFSFVKMTEKVTFKTNVVKKNYENKFYATPSVQASETANQNVQVYNYGWAANQITMLNGDVLHNLGYKGQGITMALLDAGFFNVDQIAAFDSLWVNNQILGTWDFVDNESSVYEDHSHGMSVLSTIAANIPGDIVGTAPKATFWLLRTEDANSEYRIEEDNWIAAAEFADSVGVDVINTSLGYSTFDDPAQNYAYTDMDGNTARITIGADIAASKGMLLVNSAGNSGNDSWHYITAPADGDSVFTIGAVDASGAYASFSSTGPSYDGRIKPNVVSQGSGTAVMGSSGVTTFSNGTSFSSPIIAGLVSCLWQAHPTRSNMEIINIVEQSASQASMPDSLLGYGIPDFAKANLLITGENINNPYLDELLRVYPAPFSNTIDIEFYSASDQLASFEIYDLAGKQIYTRTSIDMSRFSINTFTISNLTNLTNGLYSFVLKTDSGLFEKNILKIQ